MDTTKMDYWEECIAIAAEDCGLALTPEQLGCIAGAVESGHQNYGQAFYSPPASDRLSEIEDEWKRKVKSLEGEIAKYKDRAETAIKQALNVRHGESVSFGDYGEVYAHGGRTERVQ